MKQRSCARFAVPDARVDWALHDGGESWTRGCPLRNLSRGGVGFASEGPPGNGGAVRLRILIEGEPPLELLGRVVWSLLSSGKTYHIGVQLAPYGEGRGHNHPSALQRIATLEAHFLPSAG